MFINKTGFSFTVHVKSAATTKKKELSLSGALSKTVAVEMLQELEFKVSLKKNWVEKGFLSAFLLISFFQLLREMVCFLRAGHIYIAINYDLSFIWITL